MLYTQTLEKLSALRLDGMVHAIEDEATVRSAATLSFEERLAMLIQREIDCGATPNVSLGYLRPPSSRTRALASKTSIGAPAAI